MGMEATEHKKAEPEAPPSIFALIPSGLNLSPSYRPQQPPLATRKTITPKMAKPIKISVYPISYPFH